MATERTSSRPVNSRVLWLAVLLCTVGALLALSGCTRRQEEKPKVPASPSQTAAKPAQSPAAQPVAKAVKYTCPMHPTVVSDKPGKCPICGMDLVQVKEEPNAPASTQKP